MFKYNIIGFYRTLGKKLEDFKINQKKDSVNKENTSKLWKIIQEAGDYLGCQWYTLPDTT